MKLETTTMNEQTQQNSQPLPESTQETSSVPSASSAPSAFDDELTSLRAENTELRHTLRLRNARDELNRTLASENARSPELLFEAASSRLSFDDDGNLQNLSDIIADIKTRFPEQFVTDTLEQTATVSRTPPINAGAGRANIPPPLTKEMLTAMKPRDILSLDWNDVKQVMESS